MVIEEALRSGGYSVYVIPRRTRSNHLTSGPLGSPYLQTPARFLSTKHTHPDEGNPTIVSSVGLTKRRTRFLFKSSCLYRINYSSQLC